MWGNNLEIIHCVHYIFINCTIVIITSKYACLGRLKILYKIHVKSNILKIVDNIYSIMVSLLA